MKCAGELKRRRHYYESPATLRSGTPFIKGAGSPRFAYDQRFGEALKPFLEPIDHERHIVRPVVVAAMDAPARVIVVIDLQRFVGRADLVE